MLSMISASTEVEGTDYRIEYQITQKGEAEEFTGYGISCNLFKEEVAVAREEIQGITTEWERAKRIFDVLLRNQVFPVHLKESIEDLLVIEFEENVSFVF